MLALLSQWPSAVGPVVRHPSQSRFQQGTPLIVHKVKGEAN